MKREREGEREEREGGEEREKKRETERGFSLLITT